VMQGKSAFEQVRQLPLDGDAPEGDSER